MSYSDRNPAWGRLMDARDADAAESRARARDADAQRETDAARRIQAANPGMSWGEALRRATS